MICPKATVVATAAFLSGCLQVGEMSAQEVTRSEFGRTEAGQRIDRFVMTNVEGLRASVMTWGATLIGLEVPDREGNLANITLHLGRFSDYERGHPLFGSIVGRYANRIDTGGFEIDGVRYPLETVNRKTRVHIHGGKEGFAHQIWSGRALEEADFAGVELSLISPDGHEGYPGEVSVTVTYRLTNENALEIEYRGSTSKPTHLNLSNHAYFNLGGAGSGDVRDQILTLRSDSILAIDERKIPTGDFQPVEGTPFDFRTPRAIGARLDEIEGGGFDHCYVLGSEAQLPVPKWFARVKDSQSGRVMDVLTTCPGVQLYTANYLKPTLASPDGVPYGPHHGFCLETQAFPNSPNQENFPSTLVLPDGEYRQKTVFRFSIDQDR